MAQQAADAGFATLVEPQPASRADLERIHRHSYVESILSGNGPLSECAFGCWSEAYRDGVLAINGGNLLATPDREKQFAPPGNRHDAAFHRCANRLRVRHRSVIDSIVAPHA